MRFVNRPEIFEKLEHAIEENDNNKMPKLITLCGLGGMGKSQIALEFCYRNKEYYQYIFWMEADTDAALQSSFKGAAEKLGLPIHGKDPVDVIHYTTQWLQKSSGWLLVFDNADDYSLNSTSNRRLQDEYFPKSGRGVILMTTRLKYKAGHDNIVVDLDEIKIDDDVALKLLLRGGNDDGNALAIVKMLGHLPLALDLASAILDLERCTPTEFLMNYQNNIEEYLDPDDVQDRIGDNYGKTVFTVWEVSFDRIKKKNSMAASLIQSIAFLYPDNIPLALFEHCVQANFKLNKTVPSSTLKRAAQLLTDFSLVRRITPKDRKQDDPAKDTLYVHRLVQTAILFKMELPEKLEKCKQLLAALSHELKPVDEHSSRIMEAYVPHVRHLIEQIMQFSPWPVDRPDIVQFTQWATDRGDNRPDFSKELMSLLSPTVVYLTSRHLFEAESKTQGVQPSSHFSEHFREDFTPLHHAIQQGNIDDIIKNIAQYKIFANYQDRNGRTPLHLAAQFGNYAVVKLMVKQFEADITVGDDYGQTPLHMAAESGNIEFIKFLIDCGTHVDINRRDKNEQPPLYLAVKSQKMKVARLLLNQLGADASIKTKGKTAMQLAGKIRKFETRRYVTKIL
ncbi:hypothetical protein BC938DRAFT_477194 [Jimgerdemannia flammicorona]|uniref:DUF7779 domain-containing protein n=1 Tax=Jimgerdemannia flammicorona TaxID=994334 RepID=A0A433QPP6_9FUNG|nr:hypothetical protein BC938DRAFT_477194 [Jimgerdemannia flammicorona]